MSNDIKQALYQTWQVIGQDVEDCSTEPLTTKAMAEMVLDANHLESFGGADPDALEAFMNLPYSERLQVTMESI